MKAELQRILHDEFEAFHRRAFRDLEGKKLGHDAYLPYLCAEVELWARSRPPQKVINLPPGHLKTITGSVCGAAWILAREPETEILVVCASENLSEEITYNIRRILQADWYKDAFDTRVAKDRAARQRFKTTEGGGVRAVPIYGLTTGFRGDVLIVDDPHQIDDAGHLDRIERAIDIFDSQILSRLNDPANGRVLIIGHRVHQQDLSGHLIESGGFDHVSLPLIAQQNTDYRAGEVVYRRHTGDLLRPDVFTPEEISRIRRRCRVPDFQTLYQQDPLQGLRPITAQCFRCFSEHDDSESPIVLSIDPGQKGGADTSYSVAQVWARHGDLHRLIDQFREQCLYRRFRGAVKKLVQRYRPSAVIIEVTGGYGSALCDDLKLRSWVHVERVHPVESKVMRLARHIDAICDRRISLPKKAVWRPDYIREFEQFLRGGKSDDQIDATTQYLDFAAKGYSLQLPPPITTPQLASGSTFRQPFPGIHQPPERAFQVNSIALARGNRFFR
jgi:predicted phage terminase large subunit-like protein